jgi:glycosyltransferase involved in cell wall biosynthesis
MIDVAVVIPTLNEAQSIGVVVEELRRHGVGEVIVADGGSTDGTVEIAVRSGARVIDAGRGYGRACLAGAQAAEAALIAFMDGDGADDPRYLAQIVAPVRAGEVDFAIGSRWRGRAERGSIHLHQTLAGLVIGQAIRALYGTGYTDMCAFRVIRKDVLLGMGMQEMTYGWNLEMQLRIARAGLRILEIPVANRRRIGGQSKVAGSLSGSFKAGVRILQTFYRFAR